LANNKTLGVSMKALLLSVLFVLVGSVALASEMRSTPVASEQVKSVNGHYVLSTICVTSSDYSSWEAGRFCSQHSNAINLLSTNEAMISSQCEPANYMYADCYYQNGYILKTRMSVW
jgi:hypothetical protein